MKHVAFLLAFVFLAALPVAAQSPAQSYTARYYNVGAASPLQSETFSATAPATTCNQTLPTGSSVNPSRLFWIDTANAGKYCVHVDAPGAPLFSVPLGSYEATLAATNGSGVSSAESARAPFSRDAALSAPTGFGLVQ